ncbi:YiiX/YebB-like N1pC/P60 family cysteine hydrolase [Staphylococcus argensis]|uniref:NlpC/P60 domain-containing protein n=1 Tax=Staphylococcus argensis TaxID=1607738 RepID=A0A2K4FA89_9STAP|nr:YiiX/YebB-like N1pC/P60 family cysteine hydrolase [Staphylococcus argensis]MCY6991488.1 YiiX/YebB-like N1pC/P60 family cysteine hydrolase [Staphylococcus argensis]POA08278.1 hypothetical protein CD039_09295 [Staphylococcus argensis]
MKKFLFFLFCFVFTLAFTLSSASNTTHAEDNLGKSQYNTSDYDQLVREDALDPSVSRKQWEELKQEAYKEDQKMRKEPAVDTYSKSKYHMRAGDVLISNGTSGSFHLPGHAAIAISSKKLVHIAGPKAHPATHSLKWFKKRYTKHHSYIKMYRPKKKSAGKKAAKWSRKNIVGHKWHYQINNKRNEVHPTYCSKIVYQAYKKGVGSGTMKTSSKIILPLQLPQYSHGSGKLHRVKTFR